MKQSSMLPTILPKSMIKRIQRKKTLFIAFIIFVVSLGVSILLDPIRYKVIPLYLFSAKGVPLTTKLSCAAMTNHEVHEKFENPPAFDKESLNGLQEFWHYSLFRGCLHEEGYDMEGNKIPQSIVRDTMYENPYLGFSFKLSEDAVVIDDNVLDVETDDRLYRSLIETDTSVMELYAYRTYDYVTLEGISEHGSKPNYVTSDVLEKEIYENAVFVRYSDREALVFTNGTETIYIFSASFTDQLLEQILSTFEFNS